MIISRKVEYHGLIWFVLEEVNDPPRRLQRPTNRTVALAGRIVQTDTISVQDDEQSHFSHETSISVAEDFSCP